MYKTKEQEETKFSQSNILQKLKYQNREYDSNLNFIFHQLTLMIFQITL